MLGERPSPVEPLAGTGGALWLKRDDLNAPVLGGNKVRALEWLLGGVGPGDTVLTVGGIGSTHVLATAVHAARLGARTVAFRWRHETNLVALRVAAESERRCAELLGPTPAGLVRFLRLRRTARWVPFGGSCPLGILGHVDAALELAEQVASGLLPRPDRVVLPVGSGGTAAGLLLGFALAGLDTELVGVRVGPRAGVRHGRVMRLAHATRRLVAHLGAAPVPAPDSRRLRIAHEWYGGAYGRPLPAGDAAAALLHARGGAIVDATYGAKAAAAALSLAERDAGVTLLWLTFDGRWMVG